MASQSNDPQAKWSIEIEDVKRKKDLPQITEQQYQQGRARAFNDGAGFALASVGVLCLVFIIIALIASR